jgi:hypothetical protein
MSENSAKRLYTVPRVTVHGTLEDITKQGIKRLGLSDGFLLEGQDGDIIGPIGNVS